VALYRLESGAVGSHLGSLVLPDFLVFEWTKKLRLPLSASPRGTAASRRHGGESRVPGAGCRVVSRHRLCGLALSRGR
jgi:hypothetical protein